MENRKKSSTSLAFQFPTGVAESFPFQKQQVFVLHPDAPVKEHARLWRRDLFPFLRSDHDGMDCGAVFWIARGNRLGSQVEKQTDEKTENWAFGVDFRG